MSPCEPRLLMNKARERRLGSIMGSMQAASKLGYPPESAGRLLTTRIPVVSLEATLADVERLLIQKHSNFDAVNYFYVLDRESVLCGIFSIKNLFRLPKTTKVKDVMIKEVVSVRAHTDQEKVAVLALKGNFKAIPVLDNRDHFLGVISPDTIFDILYDEAKEDAFLRAGVGRFDRHTSDHHSVSVAVYVKKRLPWLLAGLVGSAGGALIISHYQATLKAELLLAAFIPALVYIADAVGTQSEMLFVHSALLRERISLRSYLKREIQVSMVLALLLTTLLASVAYFWFGSSTVGVTISIALFIAVIVASTLAVLLPWVLIRLNKDPAVASGPFVTILTYLCTIIIYFSIAEAVLAFLSA